MRAPDERPGGRAAGQPGEHAWVDDVCRWCGLLREEVWFLDDEATPVLALVWTDEGGQMTVRPFAPMLGLRPPVPPELTVAQALPRVPIGSEPRCPGDGTGWR